MATRSVPNEAPQSRPRSWPLIMVLLMLMLILLLLVVGTVTAMKMLPHSRGYLDRTPREVSEHLRRRAQGNPWFIQTPLNLMANALVWVDRGPDRGQPLIAPPWSGAHPQRQLPRPRAQRDVLVASTEALIEAVAGAAPGTHITLAPGTYGLPRALGISASGTTAQPIVLRAAQLGLVTLRLQASDGIHVRGSHWIFENLILEGACDDHRVCEHAFHVVDRAERISIRNNLMREFNSAVKVNAYGPAAAPDRGELGWNTIINSSPRSTPTPTNFIDIVAGSHWHVHHNHVADFANENRSKVSYGIFAKGGAEGTVIESNTVYCEQHLRAGRDHRVAVSFGGGGTGAEYCRGGQRCAQGEHIGGVIRNNLIMGCSDAGIFLNRAAQARVEHNTLIDTGGIQARFADASGVLRANLVDGPVRLRDGASLEIDRDHLHDSTWRAYLGLQRHRSSWVDPARGDLRWRDPPQLVERSTSAPRDLCGRMRPPITAIGAFDDITACREP